MFYTYEESSRMFGVALKNLILGPHTGSYNVRGLHCT